MTDGGQRSPLIHASLVAFAVLGTLAVILGVGFLVAAFLFAAPY